MINKFQQGGSAQDAQMQAFVQFAAQVFQQQTGKDARQNQKEFEAFVKQNQKELVAAFQKQSAQKAAKGAKLSYINRLNDRCPEGYELTFHKAGGAICPVCKKKTSVEAKGGNVVDKFKAERCGGKMKKK